jgi:prevent-host-death family protein
MKTIGVRELRQRASEFLEEVRKGRTLEVTAHGRPIARLVPVRADDRRHELASRGRLILARGDVLGLGEPPRAARRVPAPGVRLAHARAGER